jgi:hypothetical protein
MKEENNVLTETIVCDINAIPDGMDVRKWLEIAMQTGVCLIDSKKGVVPFMMHSRRKLKFEVKDINNESK